MTKESRVDNTVSISRQKSFAWYFRIVLLLLPLSACTEEPADTWTRHAIDDEHLGADGVDLYDIDHDGDLDVVAGWEESGLVIAYANPGTSRVKHPWPKVDVGGGLKLAKIEDVKFADLDADGAIDAVVSASELGGFTLNMHWLIDAPAWRSADAWQGAPISKGTRHGYLKVAIGQLDNLHGADIVVGTKHKNVDGIAYTGQVLWFASPQLPGPPHDSEWNAQKIADTDWVNNVKLADMDADGDNDILVSDRSTGLRWFENRLAHGNTWVIHPIGPNHGDFALCQGLLEEDVVVIAAYLGTTPIVYSQTPDDSWRGQTLVVENRLPDSRAPEGLKGIACGDLDLNGTVDIALSASGDGHGVIAYLQEEGRWRAMPIAGTKQNNYLKGIKHDTLSLADLDSDGDLDIVTTEENGGMLGHGLGVIWFENPAL